MGWILEAPRHECDLPHRLSHGVGSLWRCESCGKLWEVKVEVFGPHWGSASWWRRWRNRRNGWEQS